jgi:divalent metal cation (Fe/Co/Zn/Cd) transporter
MVVFAAAVPALLVVLVGYVAGYVVTDRAFGLLGAEPGRTPEVAGWTAGLLLLAVVVRQFLSWWRRRQGGGEHQK